MVSLCRSWSDLRNFNVNICKYVIRERECAIFSFTLVFTRTKSRSAVAARYRLFASPNQTREETEKSTAPNQKKFTQSSTVFGSELISACLPLFQLFDIQFSRGHLCILSLVFNTMGLAGAAANASTAIVILFLSPNSVSSSWSPHTLSLLSRRTFFILVFVLFAVLRNGKMAYVQSIPFVPYDSHTHIHSRALTHTHRATSNTRSLRPRYFYDTVTVR